MKKHVAILVSAVLVALMLVTVASAGTALDRILKKQELVVGTAGNQPPLNVTNKIGEIIGFEADIARGIAMNMGVKIKFVTMPFSQLLPSLKSGKVDMVISSMSMTPNRNLKVAFVGPYFISGKGVLTKKANEAVLNEIDDMNKPTFRLAALKASTSEEFVKTAAPLAKLVPVKSYSEAIDLLLQDKVDALFADYPFCAFSAFRLRDKGLIVGQAPLTFEPLGIAVPEDPLLINWLENFLTILEGTGHLKLLGQRWFDDGSWMSQLPDS
jgi:polar amino acid transport system substrate-binding protein